MSAWIVDKEHIDVLISAALHGPRGITVEPGYWPHPFSWFSEDPRGHGLHDLDEIRVSLRPETADEVGRMLWLENVESVAARYPDDGPNDRPGPADFADVEAEIYSFTDPRYRLSTGEIFQAIGCYEYQSCEHDGWPDSSAKRFCDALAATVASKLYEGPWGWTAEALAKARGGALATA